MVNVPHIFSRLQSSTNANRGSRQAPLLLSCRACFMLAVLFVSDGSSRRMRKRALNGPANMQDLRVIVAHPRDAEGELVIRHFQRGGAQVKCLWPPPSRLEGNLDLLVCLVDASARPILEAATSASGIAVVGMLNPHHVENVRLAAETTPHALLLKPVEPADVEPQVSVAINNAKFHQRQQAKISKLEETLRSYRKVEQAKTILMRQKHIEEPEAYNFLREQAMRRRVSVGMIAAAVVELDEVLSEK